MLTPWGEFERSFTGLDDLRRRMDRLFDDYDTSATQPAMVWPRVNFRDAGNALVLTAEVPGLSDKDVKLTLGHDVLAVEGERRVDPPAGYSAHRRERAPVRFARSFALPCRVDAEKTTAAVKDGVLTVTLPKAPEAQPRQITVKAG
jgi:HSP20 family protein